MAMDPDMALSSSLGLTNTLIRGGSTGHPYLYDPAMEWPLTLPKTQALAQVPDPYMGP